MNQEEDMYARYEFSIKMNYLEFLKLQKCIFVNYIFRNLTILEYSKWFTFCLTTAEVINTVYIFFSYETWTFNEIKHLKNYLLFYENWGFK